MHLARKLCAASHGERRGPTRCSAQSGAERMPEYMAAGIAEGGQRNQGHGREDGGRAKGMDVTTSHTGEDLKGCRGKPWASGAWWHRAQRGGGQVGQRGGRSGRIGHSPADRARLFILEGGDDDDAVYGPRPGAGTRKATFSSLSLRNLRCGDAGKGEGAG